MKRMKRFIALACVLCLALSFSACGKLEISREIATVNGRVITKAEFLYYLETVKEQMLSESGAQDAESFWKADIDGEKASELAKQKALEEILRIEIGAIKAEELGLTVPEDSIKNIRATVKSTDAETKAQIDAIKDSTGLSDELLIQTSVKTALVNLLGNHILENEPDKVTPAQEEIDKVYNEEYVRVKHILLMNTPEQTAEGAASEIAPEEYAAQQKAKAEEALAKAKSGANFDSLIKEYNEDPGMESSPDGYTFTVGAMVPEFEDAAFSMAVGSVSEALVESSYGYHILKKYPLLTAGEDYDQTIATIKDELSLDMYNKVLDSYKPEMTIEVHQSVVDSVKVK